MTTAVADPDGLSDEDFLGLDEDEEDLEFEDDD